MFDEVIQSPGEIEKQRSAQPSGATGNSSFNTSLLDDMNNMSMVSSSIGISEFGQFDGMGGFDMG